MMKKSFFTGLVLLLAFSAFAQTIKPINLKTMVRAPLGPDSIIVSDAFGNWYFTPIPSGSQTLGFDGDDLSISGGNTVDLSALKDNTDNQQLSMPGGGLQITNGNTLDILSNELGNQLSYGSDHKLYVPSIGTGPGSGLHADLLDGEEGSFYLDYDNFINTPPSTWLVNGSNIYRSTGNVGIGLSNPSYLLDVAGKVRLGRSDQRYFEYDDGSGFIKIRGSLGGWAVGLSIIGPDGPDLGGFYVNGTGNSANYWSVGSSFNSDFFVVRPSGNVGMGTLNPSTKLHVVGDFRLEGLFRDQTGDSGDPSKVIGHDGTNFKWIRQYGAISGSVNSNDWNLNTQLGVNARLSLPSDLNGPGQYSHIRTWEYSSSNSQGNLVQVAYPYLNSSAQTIKYRTKFQGAWSPWYSFWHNGNDGSGSGSDADLLDGFNSDYFLDYNNLSNTPALQWIESAGNLYRASGNIGLGIIGPTERLDVAGNIKLSGLLKSNTYELDGSSSGYSWWVDGTTNRKAGANLTNINNLFLGLFSGGGTAHEGGLHVFYTGTETRTKVQLQNTAGATDGMIVSYKADGGNSHTIYDHPRMVFRTVATGNTTVTATDYNLLLNGVAFAVDAILPALSDPSIDDGDVFIFKCIDDSNTVRIIANGDTIDGAADISMLLNEVYTIMADKPSGVWRVMNKYTP